MRLIQKLGPVLLLAAACSDAAAPFSGAPLTGSDDRAVAASSVDVGGQESVERHAAAPVPPPMPMSSPVAPAAAAAETKLVRTAELTIQVRDVGAALARADSSTTSRSRSPRFA